MKYLKLFENFSTNQLIFEVALLLKIDDVTKSQILKILQTSDKMEGLFPLPEEKLHVTLTSIANCKANKETLKSNLPSDLEAPKLEIGEVRTVERPDQNKKSLVVAIKNQDDLKSFVDKVYEKMGLENPEPERFFHLTIANNTENKKVPGKADPFGSIGNVTKNDFN